VPEGKRGYQIMELYAFRPGNHISKIVNSNKSYPVALKNSYEDETI
jgi:hypothetical protein